MSKNSGFLSKIFFYLSPSGNRLDPVGKEGLSTLRANSFSFGTKNYPEPAQLFVQLEKHGATFFSYSDRDSSYIGVSVPREHLAEVKPLLDEVLKNVKTTDDARTKIVNNLKMQIDELDSDDRGYAMERFNELVLGERPALGTKQSLDNISAGDLEESQLSFASDAIAVEVEGADLLTQSSEFIQREVILQSEPSEERIKLFEKDLQQKVVLYGYRTEGSGSYDYVVRSVARSLLSGGLTGLVSEKIREEHSAAYYAFGQVHFLRDKGMLYMNAGVSEENLVKCISLMDEIYQRVATGDFEDFRLEMSQKYFKGTVDRLYDSLDTLAGFYATMIARGDKIPKYDEVIEQIAKVTKEDIVKFYQSILNDNKPYLVVNGQLSDKTAQQCRNLVASK